MRFVDTRQMRITNSQIVDYMSLGPTGIRVIANGNVLPHFVYQSKVQFIVPGIDSPYVNLVKRFLKLTGYKFMGVTSTNFSSKGKYRDISGGTHKNLDEIQKNMGFLGIPILAGPVSFNTISSEELDLQGLYRLLHARYLELDGGERENCTDILPTSVTIVEPSMDNSVWRVVRHGSVPHLVIKRCLSKYNIQVELAVDKRLNIGNYPERLLKVSARKATHPLATSDRAQRVEFL